MRGSADLEVREPFAVEPFAAGPFAAEPSAVDLSPVFAVLDELERTPSGAFDRAAPILLSRAPGRLDVMGGFADYSGSLTLELPIAEAAFVLVQERSEPLVQVSSAGFGAVGGPLRHAEFPLAELRAETRSYASARRYFQRDETRAWSAYVAGALAALQIEWGLGPRAGLRLLVVSNVPEGKGVSSSAALEVASLSALSALYGRANDPVEAALVCQRVENLVVGAPCGVMDQMTSSCGIEGQLLPLLCQPAELQPGFPIPAGLALWGIDSGLRHAVSGADYGQVRVAAFMGYRWLSELRGCAVAFDPAGGPVQITDPEWGGYLARLPLETFERQYREALPEQILGAEFLSRFGGISDPITRVRPDVSYRVRAATEHPVAEHARANEFRDLMRAYAAERDPRAAFELDRIAQTRVERLGQLMYAAHDSYSACGLGSRGTDRLVELVRELGPAHGLYGAKITGGGSGGTVAVLGRASAARAVQEVAARYGAESGFAPYIFSGSSTGAARFGVRELQRRASGWRVESGVSPAARGVQSREEPA